MSSYNIHVERNQSYSFILTVYVCKVVCICLGLLEILEGTIHIIGLSIAIIRKFYACRCYDGADN